MKRGLKAPLFASNWPVTKRSGVAKTPVGFSRPRSRPQEGIRRERINPAVAAGLSLSKKLFRQAEAPGQRAKGWFFACCLLFYNSGPSTPSRSKGGVYSSLAEVRSWP